MKMESFQYIQGKGWSINQLPDLDSEHTLVLVFGSPIFKTNRTPITELAHFYKKSKMMGCSTAGEIFGPKIFDNSLSISVIQFENTPIQLEMASIRESKDSFYAGASIAQALNHFNLHSILVLSDGLNVNGSELISGLNQKTKAGVMITGGLAGDGSHFKHTWVIYNGEIFENHIVAVGFYGKHIQSGSAFRGGWDIFGPERRITRSVGNILYELDNKPVLSLYKEYLGERAAELPSAGLLYPLAIRNPSEKEAFPLVRTILNMDENTQSLIFAGDMPVGYYAQLMHANFDRLIESASEASKKASVMVNQASNAYKEPVLAIDISCVGRRLLLGERTEEETEATFNALPPGSKQIGFYSYGELSPSGAGNCDLHNQTMTITTFYERSA